uniref:zinc finger protein 251 isoform X4 n=1 Tax=Macaca mulatta TaxID=9544 RepID=UPI0010A20D53|nr:zinc finger protein 251 isoform X4 [Macaca mulatta]
MGAPPPVRDVLGQSGAGSRGEFVLLSGPKGALRRKPGQKPLGSAPEVAVRGGLRTRSRSVLGQPVDRPLGGSTVPDGSSRSGTVTPTVKVGGSIFEVSKTMNPLEGTNSGHSNSRCHSWSTCHVPGGAKCSACASNILLLSQSCKLIETQTPLDCLLGKSPELLLVIVLQIFLLELIVYALS